MPWSIELVDRNGYAVAERVWKPESKKSIQPLPLPMELDESLAQSRTPTIQRKTRVSPQSSSSSQPRRTQYKPYDHVVEGQRGRRSEQPQMHIPTSSYQYNDILHIQELQEQYYHQNRPSSVHSSTPSSQPSNGVYYFPVSVPIQHFSKFQTPIHELQDSTRKGIIDSTTSSPNSRFVSPSPSSSSSSSVHSSPRSRLLSPCSDRSSASSFSSPFPSPLSSPSPPKRQQYQPILLSQPHPKSETSLYLPPEFFNPPLDFSDDDSEMLSPSSLRSGTSSSDEEEWMFQEMEMSLEDPFTGMMRFDADVEV